MYCSRSHATLRLLFEALEAECSGVAEKVVGQCTTSIKRPRFGDLFKFLHVIHVEVSNPVSDKAPKHLSGRMLLTAGDCDVLFMTI